MKIDDKKEYFAIDSYKLPQYFLRDPLMGTIKLARFKFVAKMLSPDDVVLDLGCGHGYSSYFFAKYAKKVVGLDLYADIPSVVQQMALDNLTFYQGDMFDPPTEITNGKYSVITLIDVIEHFHRQDGEKTIEIYSKMLKSNGLMIIGTPSKYSQPYRSKVARDTHFYEYEPDELNRICRKYFGRTILFSMNDEIVHTGFSKLAWFFFILCFK